MTLFLLLRRFWHINQKEIRNSIKIEKIRVNSLALAKNVLLVAVFIFILDLFLLPLPIQAKGENFFPVIFEITNNKKKVKGLPANEDRKIKRTETIVLTAYNSDVWQCDDTPCITANGFNVCNHDKEDTVAANHLPFGTKLRIPELFGERVFIVRDRMNKRYAYRMDIWMKERNDAVNFGVKKAAVEILE